MTLSTLTTHEAKTRSDLLEVQRYDIDVDMTGLLEGEEWRSTSTVTFTCSEPGATTFVDVAMDVVRATLNGADVDIWRPLDFYSGRITRELAAVAGLQSNTLNPDGGKDERATPRGASRRRSQVRRVA